MHTFHRTAGSLALVGMLLIGGFACGGGGGHSEASFCTTLKKWQTDSKALDGSDGEPGTAEFKKSMNQAKAAVGDLKASAPDEIQSDVNLLADAVDTLANLDFSDPKAMQDVGSKVDSDKLDKASDNIEAYAKKHCKIATED